MVGVLLLVFSVSACAPGMISGYYGGRHMMIGATVVNPGYGYNPGYYDPCPWGYPSVGWQLVCEGPYYCYRVPKPICRY